MPEAHEALMKYSWPGNIRELDKTMNRLSDIKTGIVTLNDLSPAIKSGETLIELENDDGMLTKKQIDFVKKNGSLIPLFELLEKEMLFFAHKELKGNKSNISKKYNISRTKVWKFFKEVPTELHQ